MQQKLWPTALRPGLYLRVAFQPLLCFLAFCSYEIRSEEAGPVENEQHRTAQRLLMPGEIYHVRAI